MARGIQEQTQRLKQKLELLFAKYDLIFKQKTELEIRVTELESQLADLERDSRRQQETIQLLISARAVAPTRNELESSRAILSNLVREVNKCINDLNQ